MKTLNEHKIQIKSKQRVKERGEVFTNEREVKAMCDLIPNEIWDNIDSTFLEPTCGNGNFLVEILNRKLAKCDTEEQGIRALKSIYGIDIMQDNVDESRKRMKDIFIDKFNCNSNVDKILENNIICGDSLKIQAMWELEEENKKSKGKVEE